MESVAVIEMSAWIEDLLYQEALKKNHLPPTAHVWSKTESILYFQDRCEKLQRQLESKKHVNWRKVFEQHGKHPAQVLKVIMQEETEGKAKSKSKAKVKEEKVAMLADHSIPPPPPAPLQPHVGSAPHATPIIPVSAIVPVIAPKKTRAPPKKKVGPVKKAKIAEAVPGSATATSTTAAPPPPPLDLNDADAMDVDLALDDFGFDFEGDNAVEGIKLANEDMWK
eukprot:scaffold537_cov180-Ochromonas_danica.AAC.41